MLGGVAAAFAHGNFAFFPAAMCLVFVIFVQAGNNILHRYFDIKNGYMEDADMYQYASQGHKDFVLYALRQGIQTTLLLAATAGLALLSMGGWLTLVFGLLIVLAVWVNHWGNRPMSRSIFFPFVTFLVFGPIGVIGTEFVQLRHSVDFVNLTWYDFSPGVVIGFVIGVMAMNSHIMSGLLKRIRTEENRRISVVGRYSIRIAVWLLASTSVLYLAVMTAAPWLLGLSHWGLFMPSPVISLVLTVFSLWFYSRPNKEFLGWRISLVNIMFVALSADVLFAIIGF